MDAKYMLNNIHSDPCSYTPIFPANYYYIIPVRHGLGVTRHCLGGIKICVWVENLALIVRYEEDGFSYKAFLKRLFLIIAHT